MNRAVTHSGAIAILLGVLSGMAGCGSKDPVPEPIQTHLPVQITSANELNPTARSGKAQAVDVLVFQLGSADAFQAADLLSLYPEPSKPQAALGADLLEVRRLQIKPGQSQRIELQLAPETRQIAVVAAFEQFSRAEWRSLTLLRESAIDGDARYKNKILVIQLGSNSVSAKLSV